MSNTFVAVFIHLC